MIFNEKSQATGNTAYSKKEIEEIVKFVRLELYNAAKYCGTKAIKKRMEDFYNLDATPSESTIGRIISKHGLTHGRTGFYE